MTMRVEVLNLEDLVKSILEPSRELGVLFYHIHENVFYAIAYTGSWIIFRTKEKYSTPSSNFVTYDGKRIAFCDNYTKGKFNFLIVKTDKIDVPEG